MKAAKLPSLNDTSPQRSDQDARSCLRDPQPPTFSLKPLGDERIPHNPNNTLTQNVKPSTTNASSSAKTISSTSRTSKCIRLCLNLYLHARESNIKERVDKDTATRDLVENGI
jgi:hypothetical protein